MTARSRLFDVILQCVLKRDRPVVWEAIDAYIKERDDALRYFVPQPLGPFKTEWREIK